jgi:hypothetical protein
MTSWSVADWPRTLFRTGTTPVIADATVDAGEDEDSEDVA